jgi:hypothetical protein
VRWTTSAGRRLGFGPEAELADAMAFLAADSFVPAVVLDVDCGLHLT